jgi:molecular chaperone GrpE
MNPREPDSVDSPRAGSADDPSPSGPRQPATETDPAADPSVLEEADADQTGEPAGSERRSRWFGGADRKLQDKLAKAEQQVSDLQQERDRLQDQMARTLADMQNLRRQTQRQRDEAKTTVLAQLVSEFLPILDNLERATQSGGDLDELRKGLNLLHDLFMGCLERHGVERITADGQPFDPALHEALMVDPRDDVAAGTVTAEIEPGFRIAERIVRIAKVRVSAPATQPSQDPDADEQGTSTIH